VAESLRALPTERLAAELRVLQVEADRRSESQAAFDLSLRFGPNGAGLLGWPEHGLRRFGAEDVAAWADRWFSAQNAVLWLSGPIPKGLRLAALPHGEPPSRAVAPESRLPPRSWTGAKTRTVSVSVVSEQQWGIPLLMEIARQRAFDRLRQRDALSYEVGYEHIRLPGGQALEYLAADGSPGSYQRVFDGLI